MKVYVLRGVLVLKERYEWSLRIILYVDDSVTHSFMRRRSRHAARCRIGPDGVVLVAHYGEYVFDHLPFDAIAEALGATATV